MALVRFQYEIPDTGYQEVWIDSDKVYAVSGYTINPSTPLQTKVTQRTRLFLGPGENDYFEFSLPIADVIAYLKSGVGI